MFPQGDIEAYSKTTTRTILKETARLNRKPDELVLLFSVFLALYHIFLC